MNKRFCVKGITAATLLLTSVLIFGISTVSANAQQQIPTTAAISTIDPNGDIYDGEGPNISGDRPTLSEDTTLAQEPEYDNALSIEEIAGILITNSYAEPTAKEIFGLEKLDKNKTIFLGSEIPAYIYSNRILSKSNYRKFYPIILNNKVIFMLEVVGEGTPTYTLTKYLADDINNRYEQNLHTAIVLDQDSNLIYTSKWENI